MFFIIRFSNSAFNSFFTNENLHFPSITRNVQKYIHHIHFYIHRFSYNVKYSFILLEKPLGAREHVGTNEKTKNTEKLKYITH